MIAFYIMDLSMKTSRNAIFVDSINSIVEKKVVITRTAIETEERWAQKGVLVFSYHFSFEALVCIQEVRIVAMAQREG
jgi:hypothetical protein